MLVFSKSIPLAPPVAHDLPPNLVFALLRRQERDAALTAALLEAMTRHHKRR